MTNKRAPLKLFVSFYDAVPHGFEKNRRFYLESIHSTRHQTTCLVIRESFECVNTEMLLNMGSNKS